MKHSTRVNVLKRPGLLRATIVLVGNPGFHHPVSYLASCVTAAILFTLFHTTAWTSGSRIIWKPKLDLKMRWYRSSILQSSCCCCCSCSYCINLASVVRYARISTQLLPLDNIQETFPRGCQPWSISTRQSSALSQKKQCQHTTKSRWKSICIAYITRIVCSRCPWFYQNCFWFKSLVISYLVLKSFWDIYY